MNYFHWKTHCRKLHLLLHWTWNMYQWSKVLMWPPIKMKLALMKHSNWNTIGQLGAGHCAPLKYEITLFFRKFQLFWLFLKKITGSLLVFIQWSRNSSNWQSSMCWRPIWNGMAWRWIGIIPCQQWKILSNETFRPFICNIWIDWRHCQILFLFN